MKHESIDGIQSFESPGKGRGLRATRAYRIGELLFSCPAYAHVLSVSERGYICEHCFTRFSQKSLQRLLKPCARSLYRLLVNVCFGRMVSISSEYVKPDIQFLLFISSMQKAQKDRSTSEKMLLLKDNRRPIIDIFNTTAPLLAKTWTNPQSFQSLLCLPTPSQFSQLPVNCNGFTVEDEELSHLGSAVFPDVALMNHSCCPNAIVTYRGTSAEVRAVQDIVKGEEIYTSYIDLLYPTEDRIERLRDSYYFSCNCKECKTKSKDKAKMKLRKLSEGPRPEEIRQMVRYARVTIDDFRKAKHEKNILLISWSYVLKLQESDFTLLHTPPAELLEMCELSIDKMGAVFDDSNVYMLHMMYQAMGVCMFTEDYDGALSYGEKVIKPFSQLYPAYSMNVASMYLKLGKLYVALDRQSAASAALKKVKGQTAVSQIVHLCTVQWKESLG
ncbi:hypothetical protein NFI96_034154, partial [Prochilodus magdalenae]